MALAYYIGIIYVFQGSNDPECVGVGFFKEPWRKMGQREIAGIMEQREVVPPKGQQTNRCPYSGKDCAIAGSGSKSFLWAAQRDSQWLCVIPGRGNFVNC